MHEDQWFGIRTSRLVVLCWTYWRFVWLNVIFSDLLHSIFMFLNLIYDNIFFDNLIHMQRVASTSRLGLFLVSSTRFEIIVSYEYAVNMPSGDCVKYVTAVVLGTVPNYWSRIYSRYNCIIHIQTNSIIHKQTNSSFESRIRLPAPNKSVCTV